MTKMETAAIATRKTNSRANSRAARRVRHLGRAAQRRPEHRGADQPQRQREPDDAEKQSKLALQRAAQVVAQAERAFALHHMAGRRVRRQPLRLRHHDRQRQRDADNQPRRQQVAPQLEIHERRAGQRDGEDREAVFRQQAEPQRQAESDQEPPVRCLADAQRQVERQQVERGDQRRVAEAVNGFPADQKDHQQRARRQHAEPAVAGDPRGDRVGQAVDRQQSQRPRQHHREYADAHDLLHADQYPGEQRRIADLVAPVEEL
ncbi:MAG: hypothetical protein VW405_03080 [Rhodospirillaceae bacterium]